MLWDRAVYSTSVERVGYDEQTHSLLVTWKNGRTSAYAGVSEDLADQVARAPSVGQMLNTEIKPFFPHSYR